jgi:hypothetical protein
VDSAQPSERQGHGIAFAGSKLYVHGGDVGIDKREFGWSVDVDSVDFMPLCGHGDQAEGSAV